MTASALIGHGRGAGSRGGGVLGLIARALGSRQGPAGAIAAAAAPHDCAWRLLAYAGLPVTGGSPEPSTLVVEGCSCCPALRSKMLAGRWVPAPSRELVRVDGEPTLVESMAVAGLGFGHA